LYFLISAQNLANYLHFLDNNETAYRSYFDWHMKPPGLASLHREDPWCNLCQKLIKENKANDGPAGNATLFPVSATTRRSYSDIYAWWFTNGTCHQPQHIYTLN
jgi:hypothetical protein